MSSNDLISLWDKSAAEVVVSAPLAGDRETDVAIVGGGFTGLSTVLRKDSGETCTRSAP